mmetsp:Transcript_9131/g.14468  ORF Transcript_9131/g.14468 Transcript_9131/m.14468 type:complete len:201 (-) Transcript_9131:3490-4092(-)
MPRLVVGNQPLGSVVGQGPALQASDDAVSGVVDLVHGGGRLVATRGEDGRLVHEVLQVRAAHAGGAPGNIRQRQVICQLLVLTVHRQDLLAAPHVRKPHFDPSVEASRSQQGAVQDVGPVCGGHHDDSRVPLEAIHLREDLVQSLLALVVAAAHAGATLPTNGVDLVDEDDARGFLLGLLEDVPHARGAHADKHLDELCR